MIVLNFDQMSSADWRQVAGALNQGALVCLTTDTVYGLACSPDQPGALDAIYEAKGREAGKPVALMFADMDQVREMMPSLPDPVASMAEALLPGPVTVILPASADEADALGSRGADSIGVRVAPPAQYELYRHLPLPLALTSANRSGEREPVTMEEVPASIRRSCKFVIDSGRCAIGAPSTVVDLRPVARGGRPAILREGAVGRREVERLVGPKR